MIAAEVATATSAKDDTNAQKSALMIAKSCAMTAAVKFVAVTIRMEPTR